MGRDFEPARDIIFFRDTKFFFRIYITFFRLIFLFFLFIVRPRATTKAINYMENNPPLRFPEVNTTSNNKKEMKQGSRSSHAGYHDLKPQR